jgi:acyl dehydratase
MLQASQVALESWCCGAEKKCYLQNFAELRDISVHEYFRKGGAVRAGLYFEEFKVGMIFDHPLHRTITEADNVLFSTMTHNPSPLHIDAEYMKKSQFGQRLVNSCLTLSLMVGISIGDTTLGTTIANLGWDKVRFPKPLFHGDTIRVQTEVIEVRESRSKPDRGVVTFIHRCFNQHEQEVASCQRIALMHKKPGSKK